MNRAEADGVIGIAGDLGSRMALQACEAFPGNVYGYDTVPNSEVVVAQEGIDPAVKRADITERPKLLQSVKSVLENCTDVHWCAPLEAIGEIEGIPPFVTLYLHDSVMHNSMRATERLREQASSYGKIAVVHCLMNVERRVVVAAELPTADEAKEHMKRLGLRPLGMRSNEHDFMAAHSQAVFALLSEGLNGLLEQYAERGLLTPSAQELKKALDARAAKWTPTTIATMLSNPELPEFVGNLENLLRPPKALKPERLEL